MRREHIAEAPESERLASAQRLGHRLFLPALVIPLVTVLVVLFGEHIVIGDTPLFGKGSLTLMGLALACVAVGHRRRCWSPGNGRCQAADEGRRLLDTMGWAALLPLVLATLGGVFAASGVGDAVASIVSSVIPADSRLACVLAYGLGMVLFTVIMGNAFAAFPVMTAGIGLPLLIQQHGADAGRTRRDRHADRLLRNADDADGRQLQPGAGGAAGTRRSQRRDPRAVGRPRFRCCWSIWR